MRRLFLPLILLGVAVAIAVSAYVFLVYLQRPQTGQVLVAKSEISSGTVLDQSMITSIPWLGKKLPEGFIGIENKNKVINRVAAVDIVRGAPICEKNLAPKGSPAGLFVKIPEKMRAMTVKVDEVSGVAGFSRPGGRVDVLLAGTETGKEGGKEEKSSKIILQNVLVLAAGQRITQLEDKEKPQVVNTVTLLLSPGEAERLALATKMGNLLLTLRSGGDTLLVSTKGALPADVWGSQTEETSSVEIIQGGVRTKVRVEEMKVEKVESANKPLGAETPALAKNF